MANFVYFILILIIGCASQSEFRSNEMKSIEPFTKKKVEPVAKTTFYNAERAFLVKNFEKAKKGFSKVKTKYPTAQIARSLSIYRLGVIYYFEENYEKAIEEFSDFLAEYPYSELAFDAKYNLAASYYQTRNFTLAHQILSSFSNDEIKKQGKERAKVVYELFELVCEESGNYVDYILVATNHIDIGTDDEEKLYRKISNYINQISDNNSLESLSKKISNNSVKSLISYKLSQLPVISEEITESQPQILKLDSRGEKNNIGVLLPLSGEYSRFGQKALHAILLFATNFSKNEQFSIHVKDTQSNPEIAKLKVKELFYENKVTAIIGPLRWNEAIATASKCQELGVTNISLVAKEGVSKIGGYIFQNGFVPRVQLGSLIDYCIDVLNFKRFAILAPNDSFGKDMTDAFWDIVERKKAFIVGYMTYPSKEEDFQIYVKELVGLNNVKWRKMELQKLEEYKEEVKKKTKKEPKLQLPPIVDFDAIFLPDIPTKAAQIASTLSYYDVSNISLLGTMDWHTRKLFQKGGKNIDGAIFPGILYDNFLYRAFHSYYHQAFSETPDLVSLQAFEAMQIIAEATKNCDPFSRNSIAREISRINNLVTPLGQISFDESRVAQRKLSVFKLSSGEFIKQN